MKIKTVTTTLTLGVLFAGGFFLSRGMASPSHDFPPYVGSEGLQRIKMLGGVWEGTSKKDGKEEKVTVEYHVTSGGSAVVETLFPGTPAEMVTIYHDEGGKLSMTHYCMLANHPVMDLVKSGNNRLEFSLAKDGHVDAAKEKHMHALTLDFPDSTHLNHRWVCYENGKENEVAALSFTKKS